MYKASQRFREHLTTSYSTELIMSMNYTAKHNLVVVFNLVAPVCNFTIQNGLGESFKSGIDNAA